MLTTSPPNQPVVTLQSRSIRRVPAIRQDEIPIDATASLTAASSGSYIQAIQSASVFLLLTNTITDIVFRIRQFSFSSTSPKRAGGLDEKQCLRRPTQILGTEVQDQNQRHLASHPILWYDILQSHSHSISMKLLPE